MLLALSAGCHASRFEALLLRAAVRHTAVNTTDAAKDSKKRTRVASSSCSLIALTEAILCLLV
jgi:hypothetical protein